MYAWAIKDKTDKKILLFTIRETKQSSINVAKDFFLEPKWRKLIWNYSCIEVVINEKIK